MLQLIDIVFIVFYFAVTIFLSALASTRIKNYSDFIVAGRRLTAPLLAGSLVATYYGLDVTFGSPETSYLEGVSTFFIYSAPFYLSYLLIVFLIAKRVRDASVDSLPEYFETRFGAGVRLPVALATSLYSLPVLSVFGFGLLGSHFLGIDPLASMLIGAGFAALYAAAGGLLADTYSDLFQFLVMCVSVAVISAVALTSVGTPNEWSSIDPSMLVPTGGLSNADIIVYGAVALTPLVDPGIYQRIFAAKSVKAIRIGLLASTAIWAAFDWLVVYIGLVAIHLVGTGEIASDLDPARVMLELAAYFLPAGLLGLFIAGAIGTAMSTIDSYAIVSSMTAVKEADRLGGKRSSDTALLWRTRIGIFVVTLVAIIIAARFERIRDAWIVMASILASGLLVPMLASLMPAKNLASFGKAAAWGGILSAGALLVLFELIGVYDADYGTRRLTFAGLSLIREHIVFVGIPSSFICGLVAVAIGSKHRVP